MSHLDKVRNNVVNRGNSYGSEMEIINDKQIHEVILHRGCTSRFRENELITSVISCLNKKNIDFSVLDDETCCGIILYLLGDSKTADEVVKANIQKFNSHGVKKIITICPGCYEAFHDYYSKHENFDIEVIFAMDLFNDETIDGDGYIIHDPCHALERSTQVRSIIKNVPIERANSCCGFGAGLNLGSKELTKKMAQDTLNKGNIVTYCPSCYHTLNSVDNKKTTDFFTLLDKEL